MGARSAQYSILACNRPTRLFLNVVLLGHSCTIPLCQYLIAGGWLVASIITKTIKGRPYYYAVQSARVDGKPRIVRQIYLGSPSCCI